MKPNFALDRVILEDRNEIETAWEVLVANRYERESNYKPNRHEGPYGALESIALGAVASGWLFQTMEKVAKDELSVAPDVKERVIEMLRGYEEQREKIIQMQHDMENPSL